MQIVQVKFKSIGDVGEFSAGDLQVKVFDDVIVDEDGIVKYGTVTKIGLPQKQDVTYPKLIRVATQKDKNQLEQNAHQAQKALEETKKVAKQLGLDMKIVSAEYSFDTSKLIISFVAENRIDFRDLVKYLAGMFKTRIELRQIGVRDETKLVGGIGPCGRKLCCANHLRTFDKVTIKMAKNQSLSLNPASLSGACGRYMCCLAYEDENYVKLLEKMPKLNSKVQTADGEGTVVYNNVLKEKVSVKFVKEDGTSQIGEYALSEIKFEK